MMGKKIVVAGATGNLGGKIVDALIKRGAAVRARWFVMTTSII